MGILRRILGRRRARPASGASPATVQHVNHQPHGGMFPGLTPNPPYYWDDAPPLRSVDCGTTREPIANDPPTIYAPPSYGGYQDAPPSPGHTAPESSSYGGGDTSGGSY